MAGTWHKDPQDVKTVESRDREHKEYIGSLTDEEFDAYVERNGPSSNDTGSFHWSQAVILRMQDRDTKKALLNSIYWHIGSRWQKHNAWGYHWFLVDIKGNEICRSSDYYETYAAANCALSKFFKRITKYTERKTPKQLPGNSEKIVEEYNLA